MKAYPPDSARRALMLWPGGADAVRTLERIATAGNDVWRFDHAARPYILRLTHDAWRTRAMNLAECAFLEHAFARGARVHRPVPALSGARVEAVDDASASVFTWAPGDEVTRADPRWGEPLFREWGRALADLHDAAEGYEGPPRWEWRDEGLLADADRILPAADGEIRAQRDELDARLAALPVTRSNFGLIHADFAPPNFRYGPDGRITSFDFGNLCRHWFVSDLVISFSTLRADSQRDRLRGWILAGYTERRALDPAAWAERDTFLRLRILYVYLSRLVWFGPSPGETRRETLALLRALVLERVTWP
ncbi:MAG: phosphotransferase [Candidatus Eisenbacteria bacterium]